MSEVGKDNGLLEKLSDGELARAFGKGSEAAFEELYHRYRQQLYAFLNHLTGDPVFADELFEDSWLRVIDKIDRYRDDGKFSAWLFRVARNIFHDRLRQRKRRAEVTLDTGLDGMEEVSSAADPQEIMSQRDIGREIAAALQMLPPDQREVFLMRHQELSFKEIADIQKCPLNTVLSRMQYALRSLRKLLHGIYQD